MADRAIGELTQVTDLYNSDLFVLEQNNAARAMTWQTLINKTAAALDGHGGIISISYRPPETGSVVGELSVVMADETTYSIDVTNGRGIVSITGPVKNGLIDTYTINYNDRTTSQFVIRNGEKGDPGAAARIHIRYASERPSAENPYFGTTPDAWMGTAVNFSDSAPATWSEYTWYRIKGGTGDGGAPATVETNTVEYAYSASGDVSPTSGWQRTVPAPVSGQYLWTRTTIAFNTGDPIVSYGVSKIGSNGSGSGSVTRVVVTNPDRDLMSTDTVTITEAGTIPIGHQNTTTARTTQALYPIKIDAHGHITSSGTAVTPDTFGAIKNPEQKQAGQYLRYVDGKWIADDVQAGGAVDSVNGKLGTVVLNSEDVGAIPDPATKDANTFLKWDGSSWGAAPISEGSKFTFDLLWENANPSGTFSPQTISVGGAGYKMYYVVFRQVNNGAAYAMFLYPVGANFTLACVSVGIGNTMCYKRSISFSTEAYIEFTKGIKHNTNASSNTDDNNAMVPYRVYGMK